MLAGLIAVLALAACGWAALHPPILPNCLVCVPGSACYNRTIRVDNSRCIVLPGLALWPQNANGVVEAVQWARGTGVQLTARSGGHSAACFSLNAGGAVLDMRVLNHIEWDGRDLSLGAGLRWTDVYDYLATVVDPTGATVLPGGGCPTVGIAGYLLGGGYSFVSRALGMGIDAVVAMDVVLANGTLLTLTRADGDAGNDRSALWWAMRGSGGGNFAVAVRFVVRPTRLPNPTLLSGNICYPVTQFATAATLVDTVARGAPDNLALYGLVNAAKQTFCVTVIYHGSDLAAGRALLQPLLALRPVSVDLRDTDTFFALEKRGANGTDFPPGMDGYIISACVRDVLPVVAMQAALAIAPRNASFLMLWMHTGGRTISQPPSPSSYPWRAAPYVFEIKALSPIGDTAQQGAMFAWATKVKLLMQPYMMGSYVNYIDANIGTDFRQQYYGPSYARLQAVKKLFDPDNFFRFPLAI